jgi:hypothetical protein
MYLPALSISDLLGHCTVSTAAQHMGASACMKTEDQELPAAQGAPQVDPGDGNEQQL